jgi:beta-lactamase class A
MDKQRRSALKSRNEGPLVRKLPPGQRLVRSFSLASAVVLLQGWSTFNGQNQPKTLEQLPVVNILAPFELGVEQKDLETQIENLALNKPLRIGVFAVDPQTGNYIDIDGKEQFCAASIIKLPILVKALRAIDNHEISPTKMLTIKSDLVTGGSGHLQWQPVGTKVSVMETLRLMIVFSDNTATNMIIDALGGKDILNKDFKDWGLSQTKINNFLGDFTGTNKTSPYDLVYLLGRIDRGELISKESRNWMLTVLKKTRVRTLLTPGLGPGAQLAHKTGDIGSMIGDAGIVTTSDGKKYYVAMQVERPHNDLRANLLIKDASKLLYGRLANYSEIAAIKENQNPPKQ